MLLRCLILVARFATNNIVGQLCAEEFNRTLNHTAVYNSWVVVFYYAILEAMRLYEYAVIGCSMYKYWTKDDFKFCTLIKVKKTKMEKLAILLCLCPAITAVVVIFCQIMMENTVEHHESQQHNVCSSYINASKMYYAYCSLNVGRYMIALSIRCMMVITTIRICKIWKESKDNLNNDIEVVKSNVQQQQVLQQKQESKDAANEIHKLISDKYDTSGKEIELLSYPFRPWFIIPWVAYVFETSISPKNVLLAWEEGANMSFSLWVKVYTLMYSVTQFWMLLIQYLCALKMNGSHQEYCRETRKLQMTVFDETHNREFIVEYKARARKLNVEFQANYNFSPTISGFHMNIPMDSPIYVILLLLNTFVTLSQSFFDTNTPNIYIL